MMQLHELEYSTKYNSFYYIFWTADSLAIKLGLMVHRHKQNVLWKKWMTAFKVKVTAKVQNVNICLSRWYPLTPHPSPSILLPNLVWRYIIMSQSIMQKDRFVIFNIKVTARLVWSKYDSFYYNLWTVDPFVTNLVWWYIIISQRVSWRSWIAVFKVNVTAKHQNVNECLSRWYFLNSWTFHICTTKLRICCIIMS